MPTTDPRVDAYLAKAPPFAKPILVELRKRLHQAAPELEETLKWGAPFFLMHGQIFANVAAFKQHTKLGLWRGGMRGVSTFVDFKSLDELPPAKAFAATVKATLSSVAGGASPKKPSKPAAPIPKVLTAALKKNAKAAKAFAAMSTSVRRDYAVWVAEAKRAETQAKRVALAVEWIGQGKSRNWKYER